jgi:branched-chain amino acid aminotransferase
VHRYLLHNGEIRDTAEPLLLPGQVGFMNGWGVFSTLRVADGVLFAFDRHYCRMQHDAERLRVPFSISGSDLQQALLALVEINGAQNATLRVAVVRNKGGLFQAPHLTRDADIIAFTADLNDWGQGVKLTYVPNGRYGASPFAGAKITSWAQNLAWHEWADATGFDEVILLNEDGAVSECTSANVFAIQGEHVFTPPLETSGCLPGVTRAVLLEEIRGTAMTILERELYPNDLEDADQVFITSTTRDLLPVLSIDGLELSQDPERLGALSQAFRQYRQEYVAEYQNRFAHPVAC